MRTAPRLSPSAGAPPAVPQPRPLSAVPGTSGDGPVDFEAFVRRHERRLFRLVRRRLDDNGDAEEIAQETLLRAYQHRDRFATPDEAAAWTTVVAQRLVIDRARTRGRSVTVADVPETGRVGRDTAEVVMGRVEARWALDALEAMPSRQAAVLWARDVEGLSYEEIGDRFDMSEPTVRSLLHRARKALRREYSHRSGGVAFGGLAAIVPALLALRRLHGAARGAIDGRWAAVGAAGVLGAAALAVGAIGIHGGPGAPVPVPPVSRHIASSAPAPASPPPTATARLTAAAAQPAPASLPSRPSSTAPPPGAVLPPIPTVCAGAGADANGCVRSSSDIPGDRLTVMLPEPLAAVVRRIGVSADLLPCIPLPANPLLTCTRPTAAGGLR